MKLSILLFFVSINTFSQILTAKTKDGKDVILYEDKTWEYSKNDVTREPCKIANNYKEPKWNKSKGWKRTGATVDDLKKHISVDMDVSVESIVLLQLSEQLGNAVYIVCVDGFKMKYRRTGSVFRKDGEDVLKMD